MEDKISQIVHTGMTDLLESSYNLFWRPDDKNAPTSSLELQDQISQFTVFLEEVDAHVSDIDKDCQKVFELMMQVGMGRDYASQENLSKFSSQYQVDELANQKRGVLTEEESGEKDGGIGTGVQQAPIQSLNGQNQDIMTFGGSNFMQRSSIQFNNYTNNQDGENQNMLIQNSFFDQQNSNQVENPIFEETSPSNRQEIATKTKNMQDYIKSSANKKMSKVQSEGRFNSNNFSKNVNIFDVKESASIQYDASLEEHKKLTELIKNAKPVSKDYQSSIKEPVTIQSNQLSAGKAENLRESHSQKEADINFTPQKQEYSEVYVSLSKQNINATETQIEPGIISPSGEDKATICVKSPRRAVELPSTSKKQEPYISPQGKDGDKIAFESTQQRETIPKMLRTQALNGKKHQIETFTCTKSHTTEAEFYNSGDPQFQYTNNSAPKEPSLIEKSDNVQSLNDGSTEMNSANCNNWMHTQQLSQEYSSVHVEIGQLDSKKSESLMKIELLESQSPQKIVRPLSRPQLNPAKESDQVMIESIPKEVKSDFSLANFLESITFIEFGQILNQDNLKLSKGDGNQLGMSLSQMRNSVITPTQVTNIYLSHIYHHFGELSVPQSESQQNYVENIFRALITTSEGDIKQIIFNSRTVPNNRMMILNQVKLLEAKFLFRTLDHINNTI